MITLLAPSSVTTTDVLSDTEPAPEPIPYCYRINGGGSHSLRSWEHARELLHLLGLSEAISFLVFERLGDGPWAQVLGAPERMVVEVSGDVGPWRVARTVGSRATDNVWSAASTRVLARSNELWSVDPAARIVRGWLTGGGLPSEPEAELVEPLDYP